VPVLEGRGHRRTRGRKREREREKEPSEVRQTDFQLSTLRTSTSPTLSYPTNTAAAAVVVAIAAVDREVPPETRDQWEKARGFFPAISKVKKEGMTVRIRTKKANLTTCHLHRGVAP